MYTRDYDEILNENFNLSDEPTLHVLTHIDEADKNVVMDSLASKLYDKIVAKVDDIDYGSIPNTKGDITKLENYGELLETINVVTRITEEYGARPDCINTILDAIENVKERTDLWEKSYDFNMSFPIIFYNTIVLSIVSSVSLIIATSIEFIKDPSGEGYEVKFDKVVYNKSKDNLLFQNLKKFNDSCRKGEIDKAFDYVLSHNSKQLMGIDDLGIVSGVALAAIVLSIIPIMRELIFFFYHSRQQMSDYFTIQAELLQMNSEYVKNNPNMDSKRRKEVAKKQEKIVSVFKRIGNALAIDMKTSDRKAKSDASKDKIDKYKINDVIDTKPDSYDMSTSPSSSLF